MEKGIEKSEKLRRWQDRLSLSDTAFAKELERMDKREELYRGRRELEPLVPGDKGTDGKLKQTSHRRNIIFENIETQISSSLPAPKVTPRREKDQVLALKIEHFIRNEMDRLPFERINDMAERTVPIQGGVGYLVEWDNTKRTHTTVGELDVSLLHPKQLAPQPGIYTSIADMDWFILKIPTTKEQIFRKYGKSVEQEGEAEPELRGTGEQAHNEDAVTLYMGYEFSRNNRVDRYCWCGDVELEDLPEFQSRRLNVCDGCGAVKDGDSCQVCGGEKFHSQVLEAEGVTKAFTTLGGLEVPMEKLAFGEDRLITTVPNEIPYYQPDVYPLVIQRSVSIYGQLLGNSDVDMIEDQQNTVNRLEQKIIDRLMKAGTRITLPPVGVLSTDPNDQEIWHLTGPEQKAIIDVYDFSGNLQYELAYLAQVYEEARQTLGITDSFQGRKDATATSGVAKQVSAAQAAGRLESKRIMKNAAYAELFELMFKHWLAYADEPRPISYTDQNGRTVYETISRYDFLEQDTAGQYWWNDMFLFSCDTAAPLASNREAMWQETRMNLQTGAFGNPQDLQTLILFWGKMADLHYPGAQETKKALEDRLQAQQAAMMPGMPGAMGGGMGQPGAAPAAMGTNPTMGGL